MVKLKIVKFLLLKLEEDHLILPHPKSLFEFATKQKILDIDKKEKKWKLIANYFDRPFLRNFLAFKVRDLMKLNIEGETKRSK